MSEGRAPGREDLVAALVGRAIIYKARLNKSGGSYYVYLPRRYNEDLRRLHKERRQVRVIVIP